MRGIVLALALLSTPAIAADQFDLVCSAKKDRTRFRVDLTTGEYCADKCDQVRRIAEVTSGMIVFRQDEPKPPENIRGYNRVNRITGAWEWYSFAPQFDITPQDIRGTCEPAPFSGFGISSRKF